MAANELNDDKKVQRLAESASFHATSRSLAHKNDRLIWTLKRERCSETSETLGEQVVTLNESKTSKHANKLRRQNSIMSLNSDYITNLAAVNTSNDKRSRKIYERRNTIVSQIRPASKWSNIREAFKLGPEKIERDAMLTILKNQNLQEDVEIFLNKYLKDIDVPKQANGKNSTLESNPASTNVAVVKPKSIQNSRTNSSTKVSLAESCSSDCSTNKADNNNKKRLSSKSVADHLKEFKENNSNRPFKSQFYIFSQEVLIRLKKSFTVKKK